MSKAEQMRKLFKSGLTMYRISKQLQVRPQQVRNQLMSPCKKEGWKGLITERELLTKK